MADIIPPVSISETAIELWSDAYREAQERLRTIIRNPYALSVEQLGVTIALAGADLQLLNPLAVCRAQVSGRPIDLETTAGWLINAMVARSLGESPTFLPGDTIRVASDQRHFLAANPELSAESEYRVSTIWFNTHSDPKWEVWIGSGRIEAGYDAKHFVLVQTSAGMTVLV